MLLGTITMSFEREKEKGKRPDPGKIPHKM
jgi:hypothetical protein